MISTVIFDLDGTLLDTLEGLYRSANYAMALHRFPTRTLDEVRRFVGHGVAWLIHCCVPEGTCQEEEAACLAAFRAHYFAHMEEGARPYEGILPLLEALRRHGRQVGVVSNKFDGAVKALCRTYFGDLIPVALGETPQLPKKPAPDLVFACLKELGADPSQAVYVGDSEVDVATARNSGLPCLSVTWGFREREILEQAGAAALFDTPEALLEHLLA